ncbi:MAG: cytochrome P460 family protein [Pseudomonadota bacterium]
MNMFAKLGFGAFVGAIALTVEVGAPATAHAEACTTDLKRDDVTQEQANELYQCIEAKLLEGYSKATDVPGVPDYKQWPLVTTAPLVSATHGKMFVNHYVSPNAVDLYTKWEDMDGAKFPVGTIFAKEAFRISKKDGSIKRGPLFLMEKVAADVAPDGWVYTRLFPNGKYQRTNGNKSEKMVFCHECHAATLEDQDAAFFPPEEYRTN